jgi:tetrapyrrole methylase family protein / MazG family protein
MDRFERAGEAFARLCSIMGRLRAPGGCPWDREQTLDSLKPYLIEEAYETLEAIEHGEPGKHCEELGDLLLQIVFQAELRAEAQVFEVADVVRGIADKLIRRHPHVFGEKTANDAASAFKSWESVKANERAGKEGRLDGVPKSMPALLRAFRTSEKAAAIGFDWPDLPSVAAKVEEEWREIHDAQAITGPDRADRVREEVGDLLFAMASYARHLGVDPENALRSATDKFSRRFKHVEGELLALGKANQKLPISELEVLWQKAKDAENGPPIS